MIEKVEELDWASSESAIFLNPRLPSELGEAARKLWRQNVDAFPGHVFILTSGTTGLKGVALSKRAFLSCAQSVNIHIESDSKDAWLQPLPDFHVGGLAIRARSFLTGARVNCMEGWDPDTFLRILKQEKVTLTSLVPAQVFDLVSRKLKCPSDLRAIFVGGGALVPALYGAARELGWPVLPSYGMTEASSQVATASLRSLQESIGVDSLPSLQVLPHLEVRTSPSSGCLQFRGSSLLSAYLQEDRIFDPKSDGWFSSEDRGTVEGNILIFSGRGKDFIKIGGESVEMGRLRQLFEEIKIQEGILSDLAIVDVPDPRLGRAIHLFSDKTLTSEHAEKIRDLYAQKVLPFEKIREWHCLEQLPRTALGKLIPAKCLEAVGLR